MVMVMMVMGCNSGGVSEGKVNLEAKNSFLESLVAIGEGFQEIFVGFGSAIGDILGFNVVKVGDKKSAVGKHFENIKKGLESTNSKLHNLSSKISEAKNVDGITIEAIKGAIKGASDVFERLIVSVTKLAGVTNDSSTDIGAAVSAGASVGAEEASIKTVISEVTNVIEAAEKSGIKIETGTSGNSVNAAAAGASAALGSNNAGAGAGDKLAAEVLKADSWAMVDKIKNSTTNTAVLAGNDKDAGTLATGTNSADANGAGAKSNADLAAAVALKAITKNGKFSAAAADIETVKGAAVNAVNKLLGVLDLIIRKTVTINLDKIGEAVKGIKYSEVSETKVGQSDTIQSAVTK
ncbi:variable large family protein [Borrelia crocidurae]|nr:variable large family protein [Borrelia crocidurae]